MKLSEKADSGCVLNYTGCDDHCVDVTGFWDKPAADKRIRTVHWQSFSSLKVLTFA
jgi:hypothetical protein